MKLKKILKWIGIVVLAYFVVATLYLLGSGRLVAVPSESDASDDFTVRGDGVIVPRTPSIFRVVSNFTPWALFNQKTSQPPVRRR
ncbi:MAG: hypothetical protein COV31_02515 [Candidatus Yanofskybacteria bacterium CG10_big_fil_rev_8_21_14_0_10_46_23]|uniref:Uncharacterized protein n=1 Tax=Candidatus Yanofskybacteria bacterium CG10_big_fil_rev_8_21_14_0_10_46_23 TaxID=1975098 RepID=A0A2H0R5F6_9BACT|nr:MAG: hypothetical protein COV31_02515 [Candidatus Yanofskybacteria bacterium CG10_big_fil_rev_8_21_14_0_10_46_23]